MKPCPWRDDRSSLPVLVRLAAQFGAVAIGLVFLPGAGRVFQGLLPPALDLVVTGLLWVWFVNLFNFMDGIDGITASETVTIGLGVALIALVAASDYGVRRRVLLGLSIRAAAAALGFLAWNWHPAKLFLGDVGSIPLGFLLGWLLLGLAGTGSWAPALILPLYYLVDATLTLLYRLVRGPALLASASRAFLSAGGPARVEPCRGGAAHRRSKSRPGDAGFAGDGMADPVDGAGGGGGRGFAGLAPAPAPRCCSPALSGARPA